MSRKRSRIQIMYDILKVIQDSPKGAKPTHILYKSNLSHPMMTDYLAEMINAGLVGEKAVNGGKIYHILENGFKFMEKYKGVLEFMDLFDL